MNPNEERYRSELQNTLPLRNPFTAQKLRREKATLSAFTLDGLWAESQHSSGWHGANPNEEKMHFLIYWFFSLIPIQSCNPIGCLWVLVSVCVASTETHLVD
ncbi:hypothetical protein AVEN_236038-1 [Araneus ventricosus]|uniref:Uncharacterized protein n=1 Tax=Araneus ventricosus TaxID=182803 RepID=A0A4Y2LBU1_ARAVE|nr:hypothetical protein AVEN_236038-1 [Araneus ventricosus]